MTENSSTIRETVQNLSGLKILIVEDNVMNQFIAKQMITKLEGIYEVASDGNGALQLLCNESFDIVLMDLQMPGMDGYETTRQIREKVAPVKNSQIPIIALTADSFAETRQSVLVAGMNDFISKPFHADALGEKINHLCR